jgi:hypothetical protein
MGSARSAVAVFTATSLIATVPTLGTPHASSLPPVSLTAAMVPVNLDALDLEPAVTQPFEAGAADATMGSSESALDMYNYLTTQFGVLVELVALNFLDSLLEFGGSLRAGLSIALDAAVVTLIGDNIIDVLTGSPVPLPVSVPVLPGLTEPFSKIFDQIPDIGGFDTAGGSAAADVAASAGADTAGSSGADLATGFDLPF